MKEDIKDKVQEFFEPADGGFNKGITFWGQMGKFKYWIPTLLGIVLAIVYTVIEKPWEDFGIDDLVAYCILFAVVLGGIFYVFDTWDSAKEASERQQDIIDSQKEKDGNV